MLNLIKLEEAKKIDQLLNQEGFDTYNFTIVIEVESQALMNKINEDYFYRLNLNDGNTINENPEEINVNVGNTHFKYILVNDNSQV